MAARFRIRELCRESFRCFLVTASARLKAQVMMPAWFEGAMGEGYARGFRSALWFSRLVDDETLPLYAIFRGISSSRKSAGTIHCKRLNMLERQIINRPQMISFRNKLKLQSFQIRLHMGTTILAVFPPGTWPESSTAGSIIPNR